jgi:hypothetical protein
MKRKLFYVLLVILSVWPLAGTVSADEKKNLAAGSTSSIQPYLGRWDLTIQAPGRTYPSWLEVSQEKGELKARFVGRWGNARPLPKIEIHRGEIVFVSPKQEEGSRNDLVFQGKVNDSFLSGTAQGPDNAGWTWTGKKAPSLNSKSTGQWGDPISLFNGKDFSGWTFDNPAKASSWKVEKGCLVNSGAGANIVTVPKFQDFKLHIEVNCPAKANSGIYLRGRYEVQVEDDSLQEPPSHHMGAVYGFLAPSPEPPRQPGVWLTFDITLVGRYVTILQNGKIIINHQEIPGITGGAIDSHEELPGPIYLQGDHGGIAYRNIIITPTK